VFSWHGTSLSTGTILPFSLPFEGKYASDKLVEINVLRLHDYFVQIQNPHLRLLQSETDFTLSFCNNLPVTLT
jgi:hypothetical protein